MTKQTRLLLLIFSCWTASLGAQSRYAALLHKPYEQRCYLLDSLFYPDRPYDTAAFTTQLQQVAALAHQEEDDELQLEMEYRQLRFVRDPVSNSRTESRIQWLIQQAKDKHYEQLEIRAIALAAQRQHTIYNNVWASIELYMNIHQRMKEMPLARFPDKRDYLYNDLALIYYSLEDYENAKAILLEANSLPFYPVPGPAKRNSLINVDNTLGLIYRDEARYDSALFYFERAHHNALQQSDSVWSGITSGNMGAVFFLQKRYAKAIPLLERDIQISIGAKEYSNAANSLLKLAEINWVEANKPVAYQQTTQARELLAKDRLRNDFYERLNNYYLLMSHLHNADGNAPAAYRYADSALIIQDTLFQLKKAVLLARAQQKTDNEHLKLEVEKLESQQKMQALVRNGLLGVLGLLIIITLLLVSRQRLLKKQRQFAEARRQQAQKELADARTLLGSFTANIREKNELVERLTAEMVTLQTSLNEEAMDYRQTTLEQLRRNTILTDAEWETFKVSFEKVYPGWFEGIGKKLPGLSAADLRFMALSKLQLNNREMASVLGISPGAIRMSRHRIRKKYNLSDEESLELLAGEV